MSIEQQLTEKLKDAMRSKNVQVLSLIRMVKSSAQKAKSAATFDGNDGDDFWLDVIAKYVKQQKKALAEFQKLETGADTEIAQCQFEIEYLNPFLPKLLSSEETAVIVEKIIADTGASGASMMGRVMGAVMKDYKDKVDPGVVKKIALEKLG